MRIGNHNRTGRLHYVFSSNKEGGHRARRDITAELTELSDTGHERGDRRSSCSCYTNNNRKALPMADSSKPLHLHRENHRDNSHQKHIDIAEEVQAWAS